MSFSENAIPEENQSENEEAVSLSASVVLSQLTTDSATILEKYQAPRTDKVTVRFKPIGSAPTLKQQVYKISSSQKFGVVVKFLRKQLQYSSSKSLFCYINLSFAPSLDEMVGNLYDNFAVDKQLIVAYCATVAFG